ncbi:MAG: MFS transporter [Phycisphaerales bacterium]
MGVPTEIPATSPPPPVPAPHDGFAALRLPDYRRFASGYLFSGLGLRMQAAAVAWEVYERTGSEFALGLIGASQALPVICFALVGGHAADTHDRKTIIFWSQLGFFTASLALCALSYFQSPVWIMYIVLALGAISKAFNAPARGAILAQIVPADRFQNAASWNSTFFQIAAIGGPIAATSGLIAVTHQAWPVYLATALGVGYFALSISGVHPAPAKRVAEPRSFKTMLAGLQYLRHEKTVLGAITLDLFAVLIGGATALLPVFAKKIIDAGSINREVLLGWMIAMPFIGALVTSQILAHRPPFKRAGPALLWSVAGFGAATIVFGFSTNVWLSLAALFALGALDGVSVVIRNILVQLRTTDAVRGRVSAVNAVFIESSNELGSFESGTVAKLFSPVTSVVAGGIGTIIIVAGIALALPDLRRMRTLQPDEKK